MKIVAILFVLVTSAAAVAGTGESSAGPASESPQAERDKGAAKARLTRARSAPLQIP